VGTPAVLVGLKVVDKWQNGIAVKLALLNADP
jgi:hypothetical protein